MSELGREGESLHSDVCELKGSVLLLTTTQGVQRVVAAVFVS